MLPQLISWGPIQLSSLTACLILGLLHATFLLWRRTHDEHIDDDLVFDLFFLSLIAGFLGGRIGFIAIHITDFISDPWRWINVFQYPGIWEFTAVVASFGMLWRWSTRQKWTPLEIADYASVALPVFFAWWWLGRFLIGSHIGKPTTFLGVTFPTVFDARHPVQIYLAIGFIALFGILKWLEPRYRFFPWYRGNKQAAQPGFLYGVFWIGYGILNGLSLFLRSAEIMIRGFGFDGVMYIACVIFGIVIIYQQVPRKSSKPKAMKTLTLQSKSKLTVSRWKRIWKRNR